ncbi:MAG TPA: magnesium transporter [Gemmatimonadaceae bacterium]|nr:magnesium transporter [Gemmatimonadaceae bacterium]
MTPPQRNAERPVAALLAPDILALLDESPANVAAETEELHPANLADVAELLPVVRIAQLLRALPPARAGDVLEYLDDDLRTDVLEALSPKQAAALVSEMTPDDRADAIEDLEEAHAEDILSEIPLAARGETERLLAYPPESAGGLMTTEFVSVAQDLLVEEALRIVRAAARVGRREAIYTIYATDAGGRVRGVLSLRELLAAPEGSRVSDLAWTDIVTVPATADREEVARITSKYDLVAVPVVDEGGRIIGVVTVDDVIDAMVEEQTEDVQMLGGVQPLEQPYSQATFWDIVIKRGGWLILLFLEEMLTGSALRAYQNELNAVLALSFFIPLIISSGGNSGSQSATLITRALAVGDVRLRDTLRVLVRELGQGITLGIFLGAIGFARTVMPRPYGWGNGHALALVVALTLVAVVLAGTLVGAMLPLVFTKIGFDPAIASSPFVASLVDVLGLIIYFSIARQILHLGPLTAALGGGGGPFGQFAQHAMHLT